MLRRLDGVWQFRVVPSPNKACLSKCGRTCSRVFLSVSEGRGLGGRLQLFLMSPLRTDHGACQTLPVQFSFSLWARLCGKYLFRF
ncbi:hypothetical protein DY000_02041456 [Brassica cretica]|uniref:Beta-galactosidase n=1 Tax=Brassica cretica TaxID=69181 RepID=A0ABQ7BGV4_BRACR|nr:hypothetical protein DY000_02041456 [Brassica cretica]